MMKNKNLFLVAIFLLSFILKQVLEIYNYYKSKLELLPEDKKSLSNINCYIDKLEKVLNIIQEEIERTE